MYNKSYPVDVDDLVLAGLEAHKAGQLNHAGDLYAKALASNPRHADALNLSGALAFASGDIDKSIKLIGRAIIAKPTHLDAYLNLAEAYEAASRRRDAIATCNKALLVAPDFTEGHARLALLLASDGDTGRALAHARIAIALDPTSVEALCGQAMAFALLKKYDQADAVYAQALQIDPNNLRALTGRAALLCEADLISESIHHYRKALAQIPNDPRIIASLASLSEIEGDFESAQDLFSKSLKINPSSADVRFSFSRLLRDNGLFQQSEDELKKIIHENPKHAPSLLSLARMKRLPDTPNQRKILSKMAADLTIIDDHRIQAGFALGEMLEQSGEYDSAFEKFSNANALQASSRARIGQGFNRAELENLATAIETRLSEEYSNLGSSWANATEQPVFIVGLPRSGTSLVEQICSSHSQVVGLGELRAIPRISRILSSQNSERDQLADWNPIVARAEADAHAAALASRSSGALRTIDKNPHNLLRLGLISALYPNARVIRCHRDRRDVAISNYTLYFKQGNAHSNSQIDCGFAVKAINKIGDCWSRHLNINIIDIRYEDLISDFDNYTRRIIEFLGLEWENSCLNFHNTERHVGTPSSWQVRQPVYSTSVGRWKRFEKHLSPMLSELARP